MSLIRNRTRPVSPFDFSLFPLQLLLPNFLILLFPVEEIAQVVVMLLALLGKTRDYTFSILLLQLLKQPSFSASFFVFFSACLCSSCSPIFSVSTPALRFLYLFLRPFSEFRREFGTPSAAGTLVAVRCGFGGGLERGM
jgi:hypothetical protein